MNKASWILASLLSMAGATFAQNAPLTGISESTDPDKVAEVERRAQEVQSAAQQAPSGAQQGTPARSGYTGDSTRSKSKAMKHRKMRKGKMQKSEPSA
jgi:hypothetical protein